MPSEFPGINPRKKQISKQDRPWDVHWCTSSSLLAVFYVRIVRVQWIFIRHPQSLLLTRRVPQNLVAGVGMFAWLLVPVTGTAAVYSRLWLAVLSASLSAVALLLWTPFPASFRHSQWQGPGWSEHWRTRKSTTTAHPPTSSLNKTTSSVFVACIVPAR